MLLLNIYGMLAIVTGIAAISKGAIYAGITGIAGPILCLWAASGLKGSLMIGTRSQKIWGLAAALVFTGVGIGLVYHSGYWVRLFRYELSGVTWCAIGLIVGYMTTTREHAT